MTTRLSITNHGPNPVKVTAILKGAEGPIHLEGGAKIAPNETSDMNYVWSEQSLHIEELPHE